ncbi:hypothetical protein ZIOFF_020233 [Zingiber officinale]|uniref:Uncharacterized protein n=1 Tax=Zingiber officinale TaxID=94328 RepID=A0A8J5LGJ3_ZINOF|nr:hypothetical protein ZIOFF_020233 [Zingiber officinale]
METKRVFKFLMGLDKSLDEVHGRILNKKPLPNPREVFSEVHREERRKRIMMGTPTKTLLGRSRCEHCEKPGHYKETCWDLYGKPENWKPKRKYDHRGNTTTVDVPKPSPFTKDQMDAFRQILKSQALDSGKMIGSAKLYSGFDLFKAINPLIGDNEEEIKRLKNVLSKKFEVKDLGLLRYFLGMEVGMTRQGIFVS